MKFEDVYKQVEGIVKRCYKDYYLHLWEYADWRQEGMLVLYELLKSHPNLLEESQKRKLDRQPYEEVSEIGHRLRMKELYLDELVAFRSAMSEYRSRLSPEEAKQYERLMADERFKGRKAMLKDLSYHLRDFNPRLD